MINGVLKRIFKRGNAYLWITSEGTFVVCDKSKPYDYDYKPAYVGEDFKKAKKVFCDSISREFSVCVGSSPDLVSGSACRHCWLESGKFMYE